MPAAAHSPAQAPWLSHALAIGCLVLAITLPALTAIALWNMPPEALLAQAGAQSALGGKVELLAWQWVAVWIFSLLPVSCAAFGFWSARRCFAGFARGEYFTEAAIGSLRKLGAGMLAASLAGVLARPTIVLALTWNLAPGQRALSLGVGSSELLLLMFAAIVWQVAAVMRRAMELARENEAFV